MKVNERDNTEATGKGLFEPPRVLLAGKSYCKFSPASRWHKIRKKHGALATTTQPERGED